jgi:outer membrane protein
MKISTLALGCILVTILPAAAQETMNAAETPATPVITLSQTIDAAMAGGDDVKLLKVNLAVARAQHAGNVSRNSLTLGGSGAAGFNYPGGDTKVLSSYSQALSAGATSVQGAQLGVGVSGPLTSVAVSASPWIPPLPNTVNPDTAGGVGVSVSQTLWNGYAGGPAQATVDKSLLALQGRQLSTDSGLLTVVYRVKQAYFAMFDAQLAVAAAQQVLQQQSALLQQLTAVHDLKQLSDVDLRTAQINARSARLTVQNAQNGLRQARVQLAILMGRPTDQEFSVAQPDPQAVPAQTAEEAVAQALQRRVDIRLVELSRRSNAVDLAVARGQATPTVSVSGGVNDIVDYKGPTTAWYANIGLRVAMPILDAGAVANLVEAAQQQDQAYAVQLAQLQKGIAAAVQADWENVTLANEKVELARQTADNDDQIVEVYKIQRQAGTASTQDLLTASVNAANARTAYVQAQSTAQLAVLQLLNDMGY